MEIQARLTLSTLVLAGLSLCCSAPANARDNSWTQIHLEGPIETVLPDGTARTLEPSCSGGPVRIGTEIRPGNTAYYFFVQAGNPNRIVFALDGGGACWDAATCIGSPLAGSSTYTVELDETPDRLANAEGLFDSNNPDNPFKNYTKIFVPYCTGDVHWGSKDTLYELTPLGPGTTLTWPIRHRGTDNFLAVLDWVQKYGREYFRIDLGRARDVTVTGASAGAYGANVAFGYIAELTKRNARLSLIADAGIGVLSQSFYETALYDPAAPGTESWGVAQNLPSWVPGFDTVLQTAYFAPNTLVPMVFKHLYDYKPNGRYASLTSNFDLTQIGFYGLMVNDFPPGPATALDWYINMTVMTQFTASMVPNYRYFIEDGTFHTFIGSDQRVYEGGASGYVLADWIRNMIKPGNRVWDNVDAGPPSPP